MAEALTCAVVASYAAFEHEQRLKITAQAFRSPGPQQEPESPHSASKKRLSPFLELAPVVGLIV